MPSSLFKSIFIFIAFLYCATEASSLNKNDVTGIIELTDENFEQLTQASTGQTTGKWFVFFSSPTCPHCTKLYPKWKALSEELAVEHPDSSVLIAIVDVPDNPHLVQRFTVTSMPSLYLFADRGMYEYNPQSPRDVKSFVDYVLGGYQSGEKLNVPARQTLLQVVGDLRKHVHDVKFLNVMLHDLEDILLKRKNAAVLLFLTGAVFGILLCTLKNVITSFARGKKTKLD